MTGRADPGGCQQVEHIISTCCVLCLVPDAWDAAWRGVAPLRVSQSSPGRGSGCGVDHDSRISEPGTESNQGGLPGGGLPISVSKTEQQGPRRKRPCRGGGAGEVQSICPSRRIWSSQGPGCKAEAGKDVGLGKDEFQPPWGSWEAMEGHETHQQQGKMGLDKDPSSGQWGDRKGWEKQGLRSGKVASQGGAGTIP